GVRLDERLGAERARLVELEAQQEAAREQRVHWQVEAAQVEAHLAAARARVERAVTDAAEARRQGASLADEMGTIDHDVATQTAQQGEWTDALKERGLALGALDSAAREAAADVEEADARLAEAEGALETARKGLDVLGAEEHKLERSEEHTSELQSRENLVCRLLLEKKK